MSLKIREKLAKPKIVRGNTKCLWQGLRDAARQGEGCGEVSGASFSCLATVFEGLRDGGGGQRLPGGLEAGLAGASEAQRPLELEVNVVQSGSVFGAGRSDGLDS